MREYSQQETAMRGGAYESASRGELYETTSGAQSLRRYKRSPAYRLQLRRVILDAESAELRATTPLDKKRMKLRAEIARLELGELECGGEPRALYGHIALKID